MFEYTHFNQEPSEKEIAVMEKVETTYREDFMKFSILCNETLGVPTRVIYVLLASFICWLFFSGKMIIKETKKEETI